MNSQEALCCMCCAKLDDKEHMAIMTTCFHIFGQSCIAKWTSGGMRTANKCPLCNAALFIRTRLEPCFDIDLQFYYELPRQGKPSPLYPTIDVSARNYHVRCFVSALWCTLFQYKDKAAVTYFDVDSSISRAGYETAKIGRCRLPVELYFDREQMPKVREVAMEMIQFMRNGGSASALMDDKMRDTKWIPRFARAVGERKERVVSRTIPIKLKKDIIVLSDEQKEKQKKEEEEDRKGFTVEIIEKGKYYYTKWH